MKTFSIMKIFVYICIVFLSSIEGFLLLCSGNCNGGERHRRSNQTDIKHAPYNVALLLNYLQKVNVAVCGGAILKPTVIISAARCTHETSAAKWRARAGSSNYKSGGQLVQVKAFVEHPEYQTNTHINDLVLVFLKTPLEFGENVKSIEFAQKLLPAMTERPGSTVDMLTSTPMSSGRKNSVPTDSIPNNLIPNDKKDKITTTPVPTKGPDAFANNISIANGWDSSNLKWWLRGFLQTSTLKILKNEKCAEIYQENIIINSMVCASRANIQRFLNYIKTDCEGYLGGPLTDNGTLVGITSWGSGCYTDNLPIVFTRVSYFSNWINSTLELSSN